MINGKEMKLYNILFPIWLILLIPTAWLVVLPVNFIVDSVVLLIAMRAMNILHRKNMYKKTILKIWIFGFLSDIIGALAIFGAMALFELNIQGDEPILTIPATLIAAIFIFIFNYKISFKGYDKKIGFKMALTFAIATAPYTFLIPLSWIYY